MNEDPKIESKTQAENDNWLHRSATLQCATCMWWVNKGPTLGRCRKHAPKVGEGWPAVYATDWCGDHKIDAGKL